MQTFFNVISFPFFFFGIIFMIGAFFGNVTISNREATPPEKFVVFIIGAVLIGIAYILIS